MKKKTPRPIAPPPRRAPSKPMPVGEAIMAQMGIKSADSVDFDAIEKLLAEPAPKEAVQLTRLREREQEEERVLGLQQALREHPNDIARLELLAISFKKLERRAELLELYRRMQVLAPDRPDIAHMIAALSGQVKPARASDDYVRKEFDAFAENFDSVLATWLDYRAPQLVCDAIKRALGDGAAGLATIDLGCGTGLAAPLFRDMSRRLEGVDLSSKMVEKARLRGGYDALFVDEIGNFLASRRGQYTLAIACDVFCYFGELADPFRAIAASLKPGGVFALTVERQGGEGFVLLPNGRYAHADAFVRAAGSSAGLALVEEAEVTLRTELHQPVIGGCYVFRRA